MIARGELHLLIDEQIERLPLTGDLKDLKKQELLPEEARVASSSIKKGQLMGKGVV